MCIRDRTIADKRVVMVGTGRLLDITDFGSTKTQSFYAIADGATLANARSGLVTQTYSRGANPELTGAAVDWPTDPARPLDLPAGAPANTPPHEPTGTADIHPKNNRGNSSSSTC